MSCGQNAVIRIARCTDKYRCSECGAFVTVGQPCKNCPQHPYVELCRMPVAATLNLSHVHGWRAALIALALELHPDIVTKAWTWDLVRYLSIKNADVTGPGSFSATFPLRVATDGNVVVVRLEDHSHGKCPHQVVGVCLKCEKTTQELDDEFSIFWIECDTENLAWVTPRIHSVD